MEPKKQKPSIGRIVHFHVSKDAEPMAAIITKVWNDTTINVSVFNASGGVQCEDSLTFDSDSAGKCWRWPPYVG